MNSTPVDLTNLHELTDGDRDFELQMFEAFFESAQQCLANLEASLAAEDSMAWRAAAHAFKGVAYNLGAQPLAEVCKAAQEGCDAEQNEKAAQLKAIHSAYGEVQQFLMLA